MMAYSLAGAAPVARPTKYDQPTADAILRAVADGLPNGAAANLAGVTERTLYHWLKRGRAGEEPFLQFLQEHRRHQARAVVQAVGVIRAAAERGQWRAAAWWLERRHPDEFVTERRRIRELERAVAELTRRRDGPPLTDEQRVAALTALLGRMGLAVVPAESVDGPQPPGAGGDPGRLPAGQAADRAARVGD